MSVGMMREDVNTNVTTHLDHIHAHAGKKLRKLYHFVYMFRIGGIFYNLMGGLNRKGGVVGHFLSEWCDIFRQCTGVYRGPCTFLIKMHLILYSIMATYCRHVKVEPVSNKCHLF